MIQVIDGNIKQTKLPKSGQLSTGETISGYHLLSKEILEAEGWLPLEDIKPQYNRDTQRLVFKDYEILEDKVIARYKVVEHERDENPADVHSKVAELQRVIDVLLGGEDDDE